MQYLTSDCGYHCFRCGCKYLVARPLSKLCPVCWNEVLPGRVLYFSVGFCLGVVAVLGGVRYFG